ncbi:MAG: hypothetical protein VKK42_16685 [Lyngbya sp.]|nr:hypothetical protein [Lyngbya sp.]
MSSLLKLANAIGWDYGSNFLRVRDEAECDAILGFFSNQLAETAYKSARDFWIIWGLSPDERFPIPPDQFAFIKESTGGSLMTQTTTDLYGITIASLDLDETLLRLFFDEFLPNPDKKLALIRNSDKRQVAISAGTMANVLRPGISRADVVKRVVWDYGYWLDIEEIDTEMRLLTPNNPDSSVIAQLRMHDTCGGNWRLSKSKVRLIQDSSGVLYRFSESLEVEKCPSPIS